MVSIRWLIQDPDLRNLHVDSDAVEYVPGAPVRVTVRLLGHDYQPLPGGIVVTNDLHAWNSYEGHGWCVDGGVAFATPAMRDLQLE